MHLSETLESQCQRLGATPLSLAEANRRLRAGEPATALPMVLRLHEQQPMTIDADNALYAARTLGLTDITSIDPVRGVAPSSG